MKKGKTTPPPTLGLDKPLEISEIKTGKATEVRDLQQSLKKRVGNIRRNPEKYTVVRLEELVNEIEDHVRSKRHELTEGSSVGSKMNGRQIMLQLSELEQSLADKTLDVEERKSLQAMKKDLEKDLPVVLNREAFQWFLGEANKLRSELEGLRPSIQEAEKQANSVEEESQLRRQIALLKGYSDVNMLNGDVMKQAEVCASVPKTTRELLFHPVWLSRKLEKEFTCVVEKSRDVHSKSDGCYIAGTRKDVDACIHKLETMDLVSGKKHLLLDGKTIGQVMGIGQANAFEIEKECGVILFAPPGGVELTIYGDEKSVAKALGRIQTPAGIASSEQGPSVAVNITSERVKCNTAVGKAFLNLETNIEQKCGVSITLSPSEEDPRSSWLVVRGLADNVGKAVHEIQSQTKRMHLVTVDTENTEALDKLLTSGSSSRKWFGEVKLAMRFSDLKKKAVFVRVGDTSSVDIVFPASHKEEEILNEFLDIVRRSLFETVKIELAREHSRCWNDAMCSLIASSASGSKRGDHDITVFYRRNDDEYWLELWGSESACANAQRLVKEVHDAKIIAVPEECVKPMLENKCQVLQSIQEEATVSAFFSKNELELWLYGLDPNKRAATKLFALFVDSVHQAMLQHTVKTIPIASDEIGRLIGPKGRTMNGIKEKADLEEIRISETEKKVYLTGSNSSIDHAISLIEEELSARKDPAVVQIGLAESEETVRSLTAGSSQKTEKKNEWITKAADEHVKQELVSIDNQDLFPALGAASKPSKKR
jgi:hypothetical protein